MPIITFVNKLDREGRDPFDLIDEVEQSLALDATPASWPIGMGRDFLGTYDLFHDASIDRPTGAYLGTPAQTLVLTSGRLTGAHAVVGSVGGRLTF